MAKEGITCEVLHVFFVKEVSHNRKNELRVAQWSNQDAPVLEYRRFYLTKNGEWKTNKNVGLDKEAWKQVVRHNKEISKLLSGEQ